MATGNGHGGLAGMRDALDACIHRLRRGSSLELALAECGAMADALRPLVALAERLSAAARPAPAPSAERLAAGRARFLAAAGALRGAPASHTPYDLAVAPGGGGGGGGPSLPPATPDADDDAWLTQALDAAIAELRRGASIDAALAAVAVDAAAQAELARHLTTLVDLLALVGTLQADRDARPVPPPPAAGLAAGRARFLAAAEAIDADAAEALDARLAAVAPIGAAVDLARFQPTTAAAAPDELAALARALSGAAAPVPPPDLAPGRDRFLAMAAAAEMAAAEAFDAGLAAAAGGASVTDALTAAGADGRVEELAALVALAGTLAPAAIPAPAADLSAGRARFLAIAAQAGAARAAIDGANRAAAATAQPSLGRRLGGWLRRGAAPRPLAMRLGVLGSLAAAALLSIGTAGRVPAVAAALPGDTLYTVKEWSRDAQLLLSTFDMDAARRDAWRARIQTERLVDTLRAHADGRTEETSFSARYDAFKTESQGEERPFGTLWVTRLDADERGSIGLSWRDGETRFDLPDGIDSMADVAKGAELKLRVRTGETEMPLALRVTVKGVGALVPLTATATVTATPAITRTETPAAEATSAVTATATVSATQSAPPTATTVVTVTTPVASETPAATETATTSGEGGPGGARNPYFEGRVQQMYETAPGSGAWRWRIIHRLDGQVYEIDVSGLSDAERAKVKTDGIVMLRLKGPLDTVQRTGVALSFEGFEPVSCRNSRAIGLVREYRPGDRLVIELGGGTTEEFQLGADRDGAKPTIVGEIRVGGQVHVDYRVCGGRTANIATVVTGEQGTATAGTETGERVSLIGTVTADPIENGRVVRFDLWAKRNNEAFQSWAVEVDTGRIKGVGRIAKGQRLEVRGRLVNREILVIVADEVRYMGEARPTESATPTALPPDPTATAEPPTPEPPAAEPTAAGSGGPPAEPPEPTAWPTIPPTPAAAGTAEARRPAAGRLARTAATPPGATRARS